MSDGKHAWEATADALLLLAVIAVLMLAVTLAAAGVGLYMGPVMLP